VANYFEGFAGKQNVKISTHLPSDLSGEARRRIFLLLLPRKTGGGRFSARPLWSIILKAFFEQEMFKIITHLPSDLGGEARRRIFLLLLPRISGGGRFSARPLWSIESLSP
jgi:hypothetical protein